MYGNSTALLSIRWLRKSNLRLDPCNDSSPFFIRTSELDGARTKDDVTPDPDFPLHRKVYSENTLFGVLICLSFSGSFVL